MKTLVSTALLLAAVGAGAAGVAYLLRKGSGPAPVPNPAVSTPVPTLPVTTAPVVTAPAPLPFAPEPGRMTIMPVAPPILLTDLPWAVVGQTNPPASPPSVRDLLVDHLKDRSGLGHSLQPVYQEFRTDVAPLDRSRQAWLDVVRTPPLEA
ncbi:hypothetical protein [Deinococcus sp. RIT780]|uniref:hypothetical protein n=1 Tax=Deinococcus sp. RIT780 TaxID=2870472 RepID=UPI001C89E4B9|nr:hypothetical protein [Deinococcus sp. RIT780]MBX8464236.1 hypothetical protein [Deinococcus sp. RIT780]